MILTAYALAIGLGFHRFVVCYEEPILKARCGTEYEQYCRAVPRWSFRLRSWRSAQPFAHECDLDGKRPLI